MAASFRKVCQGRAYPLVWLILGLWLPLLVKARRPRAGHHLGPGPKQPTVRYDETQESLLQGQAINETIKCKGCKPCYRATGTIECGTKDKKVSRRFGGVGEEYRCGKTGGKLAYLMPGAPGDCTVTLDKHLLPIDPPMDCKPCKFGVSRNNPYGKKALGDVEYDWVAPKGATSQQAGKYTIWANSVTLSAEDPKLSWVFWQALTGGLYRIKVWVNNHPKTFLLVKATAMIALGVATGGMGPLAVLVATGVVAGLQLMGNLWDQWAAYEAAREEVFPELDGFGKAACALKASAYAVLSVVLTVGTFFIPVVGVDEIAAVTKDVDWADLAGWLTKNGDSVIGSVVDGMAPLDLDDTALMGGVAKGVNIAVKAGATGVKQVAALGWTKISCTVNPSIEYQPLGIEDVLGVDVEHPADSAVALRSPCESECMAARGRIHTADQMINHQMQGGCDECNAKDWTIEQEWPYSLEDTSNIYGDSSLASDVVWEESVGQTGGPAHQARLRLEEKQRLIDLILATYD